MSNFQLVNNWLGFSSFITLRFFFHFFSIDFDDEQKFRLLPSLQVLVAVPAAVLALLPAILFLFLDFFSLFSPGI